MIDLLKGFCKTLAGLRHRHRQPRRGGAVRRRLHPQSGRHRALQVRGVADQRPDRRSSASTTTGASRPAWTRSSIASSPKRAHACWRWIPARCRWLMAPAPSQLDIYRDDPRLHSLRDARRARHLLRHDDRRAPLDDVRVRQAMVYGFDKQAVLDNIVEGAGYFRHRLHLAAGLRFDRHQRVLPLRSRAGRQLCLTKPAGSTATATASATRTARSSACCTTARAAAI